MSLAVQQFGQGEAVVILHGLLGCADNWRSIAQRLAQRFCLYCIDLPNHGRSPALDPVSYAQMALQVNDTVQALGRQRYALLGHSMGGKVAMQLSLMQPQCITALVVADIAPKSYDLRHTAIFAALQALPLDTLSERRQIDQALARSIDDVALRQFLLKSLYVDAQQRWAWRFNLPVLAQQYAQIAQFPDDDYPAAAVPTRFIRGELSDYILPQDHARIKQLFPAAQIVTLAQCGHWLHAQNPEGFVQQVLAGLESVDTGAVK